MYFSTSKPPFDELSFIGACPLPPTFNYFIFFIFWGVKMTWKDYFKKIYCSNVEFLYNPCIEEDFNTLLDSQLGIGNAKFNSNPTWDEKYS